MIRTAFLLVRSLGQAATCICIRGVRLEMKNDLTGGDGFVHVAWESSLTKWTASYR